MRRGGRLGKNNGKKRKRNLLPLFVILGIVLVFLILYFIVVSQPERLGLGNVALVKIDGVITTDESGFSFAERTSQSSEIIRMLEESEKNPQIKGILIEINSPGGSAVASEEIANQIRKMKKPKVALIRDIGASGAYWVASAADRIVASPVSITGSIGVTASYLEFTRLMEKYGIKYEELTSGEHKDMGSPFRNLTEDERELFRKTLDETRSYFIEKVAENRNMKYEEIEKLATGQIYTGREAKELGLIDELGSREEAENILKRELRTEKITYYEYERKESFFNALSDVMARQSFSVGEGIGNVLSRKAEFNTLKIKT